MIGTNDMAGTRTAGKSAIAPRRSTRASISSNCWRAPTTRLSQAEIAKALERSPNEIYRMLDRLVRRDYVRRTQEDRYELTLKIFELGHPRPPMRRLVSQATPVLRQFALKAEQACHLVIQDRNILVVVAQVDGPGYWNVSIRVGSRISLVNTGSGHVFLAFATPGRAHADAGRAGSGQPRENAEGAGGTARCGARTGL